MVSEQMLEGLVRVSLEELNRRLYNILVEGLPLGFAPVGYIDGINLMDKAFDYQLGWGANPEKVVVEKPTSVTVITPKDKFYIQVTEQEMAHDFTSPFVTVTTEVEPQNTKRGFLRGNKPAEPQFKDTYYRESDVYGETRVNLEILSENMRRGIDPDLLIPDYDVRQVKEDGTIEGKVARFEKAVATLTPVEEHQGARPHSELGLQYVPINQFSRRAALYNLIAEIEMAVARKDPTQISGTIDNMVDYLRSDAGRFVAMVKGSDIRPLDLASLADVYVVKKSEVMAASGDVGGGFDTLEMQTSPSFKSTTLFQALTGSQQEDPNSKINRLIGTYLRNPVDSDNVQQLMYACEEVIPEATPALAQMTIDMLPNKDPTLGSAVSHYKQAGYFVRAMGSYARALAGMQNALTELAKRNQTVGTASDDARALEAKISTDMAYFGMRTNMPVSDIMGALIRSHEIIPTRENYQLMREVLELQLKNPGLVRQTPQQTQNYIRMLGTTNYTALPPPTTAPPTP